MTFATTRTPPGRVVATKPVRIRGRWAGGGAASNMTRSSGRAITSVNYNSATGAYIITFANVGETYLGAVFGIESAGTTAAQKIVNAVAYSASAKTLTIFITDVATPTAKDLATTEFLTIDAEWDDSDAA